jgi:hypothetical protein
MFGINKPAESPAVTFKKQIDAAMAAAAAAHVPASEIIGYLKAQVTWLENASYRPYTPSRMYDGNTGELVDETKMVEDARAERQRRKDEADIIPPHLRQSAASGIKVR